jgi:NAD(P)-dependent dehydrogenase (short-subunit alcohol dehydrogenase family)
MFPAGSAIIFGGSGGLGGAIAQSFAAHGSAVTLSYRDGEDRAEAYARAIRTTGGTARTAHVDISDPGSINAALDEAAEAGPIHSVVFASGPHIYFEFVPNSDVARLREYVDADLFGFLNVAQAAIPHLRASRGAIVALATCGVSRWLVQDILSILPKSAVWSLIQGLAKEEGRYGVRANAIGVGVIDAGMTVRDREAGRMSDDFLAGVRKMTSLRRIGEATHVAEAAAFLASNRAAYLTGQLVNVDGGLSA